MALKEAGTNVEDIVNAIQGVLIHGSAMEYYGLRAIDFSRQTLPVRTRLEAIFKRDDRPLNVNRSPEARALGTCRDYSLLVCSALREQGKAARVRCGFASYLGGAPWEDHWICEHWSKMGWQRIDAQLDDIFRKFLDIHFSPVSVPEGAYLTADVAWRKCRSGELDANNLGHGETRGLWFVYVNLVRDRLALDDRLTSEWDGWRTVQANPPMLSEDVLAVADKLAEAEDFSPPRELPWVNFMR